MNVGVTDMRNKKTALKLGYLVEDATGASVPNPSHRIMRPITDPEWNRKQMNTRVRMSKKDRRRSRKAFAQAIQKKGVAV